MHQTSLQGESDVFNVLFVGAGNVMFGSDQGPWNHSLRLERKLGSRLRVVGVIDPDTSRALAALSRKRASSVAPAYEHTRVYHNFDDFIAQADTRESPRAVIVGSLPMFRGTTQLGRDIELRVLGHLPGCALFLEKPIATGPQEEIREAFEVARRMEEKGALCGVGYMLRYLKAVKEIKKIIQEYNLTVMCTIARYACAYESIAKAEWWSKTKSAGPIVEQATHLCDLSRYFGGEVDLASILAHSVEWDEDPGRLSKVPIEESKIEEGDRIPRVTSAIWKYANGAVGTLIHVVALQGTDYNCDLEVIADGWSLKLVDIYTRPRLLVRKPGDDSMGTMSFDDGEGGVDDPFFSEISTFIDTIEGRKDSPILSPYEDACKTYELTWAIRAASERSRDARRTAVTAPT